MAKRFAAFFAAFALIVGAGFQAPASATVVTAAPPAKPGVSDGGHQVPVFETDKKTGQRKEVSAQLLPPDPGTVYYWQGGVTATTTGVGASAGMRLNAPYKHSHEYHTISEIAVLDVNSGGFDRDIVEIGFGITLAGCGQIVTPCLWGGHWIADGAGGSDWQGWNAGFTDYASSLNLGDTITSAETAGCTSGASARSERYAIRKNDTTGVWMLWADLCFGDATAGEWLGHFDDANWTAAGQSFTSGTEVQVFSEVLSAYEPSTNAQKEGYPCSDGGSGYLANSNNGPYPASGQRMADITIPNVANSAVNMTVFNSTSDVAFDPTGAYDSVALSTEPPGNIRYFNTGGPGFAGTTGNSLPGNVGSC